MIEPQDNEENHVRPAAHGAKIGRKRQGLRKALPDLIVRARDDNAGQVNRILLTFVGTALFCMLSLFTPDSVLLSDERLNVPFAGPVSFSGFIIVGPLVLIVLRISLEIYIEHGNRLDRIARQMSVARAPILIPLNNPFMRAYNGFARYLLLPLAMLLFTFKAAVFAIWGAVFLWVSTVVILIHIILLFGKLSWRSKAFLSIGAALLAGGVISSLGTHPLRPFQLYFANLPGVRFPPFSDFDGAFLTHANLQGARLSSMRFFDAYFGRANLSGAALDYSFFFHADFSGANLSGAGLDGANFSSANLAEANLTDAKGDHVWFDSANLTGAKLTGAKLTKAHFTGADLTGADLTDADLTGADGLTQQQLDMACGNPAELPSGLKPGPTCKRR